MRPSQETPRTALARRRGAALGAALRRNYELAAAAVVASGWTLDQLIAGAADLAEWKRTAGLWPAVAFLALGIGAIFLRRLLGSVQRLEEAVGVVAQDLAADRTARQLRDEAQDARLAALSRRLDAAGLREDELHG